MDKRPWTTGTAEEKAAALYEKVASVDLRRLEELVERATALPWAMWTSNSYRRIGSDGVGRYAIDGKGCTCSLDALRAALSLLDGGGG